MKKEWNFFSKKLSREEMKNIAGSETDNPSASTCKEEPADQQSVEYCEWVECTTMGYTTGNCRSIIPAHLCDNN